MALDKTGLKSALEAIFSDVSAGKTPASAAQAMADAIDAFVKTAQVTVPIPAGTVLTAAQAGVPNPAPIVLAASPTSTLPGGLT